MTEHTAASPSVSRDPGQTIGPGGPTGPVRVTAEEYMEKYAHDGYEWADGELEPMSPIIDRHNELQKYLIVLLDAYFILRPIGKVRYHPFLLRLDAVNARREPDIMVILGANPGEYTPTAMIGPPDIVIEIVSPESVARDFGKKFVEYEKSGIKEYWLFDHLRKVAHFNRLNEEGLYQPIAPDADGNYESPLLPGLNIHVATLWQDDLPNLFETGEAVRTMLAKPAENE